MALRKINFALTEMGRVMIKKTTTATDQPYQVSIYGPKEADGTLIFTFVPQGSSREPQVGVAPRHRPRYIIAVRLENAAPVLDWTGTPDEPGAAKEQIEIDIKSRMQDRAIWMSRVNSLVDQIEQWAKELDWSTRRVEKKLDDLRFGKHRVPALLMQEDTCRILLEPVGASAQGAEGIVDLYLMPAYDDIASLYYYGNGWNLHYVFQGAHSVATIREADAKPLSKGTLSEVLAEMKQNAE